MLKRITWVIPLISFHLISRGFLIICLVKEDEDAVRNNLAGDANLVMEEISKFPPRHPYFCPIHMLQKQWVTFPKGYFVLIFLERLLDRKLSPAPRPHPLENLQNSSDLLGEASLNRL